MSELKHTPGPWTYAIYNVIGSDERPVALVASSDADRRTGKTLANGNLIAAAPDLLEACKEALDRLRHVATVEPKLNGYGVRRETIEQLTAAIAKAKGEKL